MKYYYHTAVVLSMFDTGVATARCLGRLGISVQGYDYNFSMPGFRSRYCNAKLCPDPTANPEDLLNLLLSETDKNEYRILYPCSDEYVLFVSRFRDELKTKYKFLLPEKSLIESIIDKTKQYNLIKRLGIDVPDTHFVDSIEKIMEIKDTLKYPIFIKPVYGFEWKKIFNNKGFKIHNEDELLSTYREIYLKGLKVIVQEVIQGPCHNNYEVSVYVGTSGDILGEFTIRKLRQYPIGLGFGTLTVNTRNKDVEELSYKIMRELNWRGFANIEFKYDEIDKKYKFIEINARVWQQISHAEKLGLNFPLLQYLNLNHIKTPIIRQYQDNIKWMDLKFDFLSSFEMLLKHEMSLYEWIKSLRGVKALGLFAIDDLKPFLYSIKYGTAIFKFPKYIIKLLSKK